MLGKRKCAKCGQEATHKFTRIRDGQIFDIFLCAEHAAEMSPYQKPKIPLSEILETLLKQEVADNELVEERTSGSEGLDLRCHHCGLHYSEYRRTLMLGCADCYEAFKTLLKTDLRKFHGATQHTGNPPSGKFRKPVPYTPPRPEPQVNPCVSEPVPCKAGELEEVEPQEVAPVIMSVPEKIDQLRGEMKAAIEREDFAAAAQLRDEIRALNKGKE